MVKKTAREIPNPREVYNPSSRIYPTKINKDERISFNFHYLKEHTDKFKYSSRDKNYLHKLIEKLKCFSEFSVHILRTDKRLCKVLRHHEIRFREHNVSERTFGIPNEPWCDDNAYQFSLWTSSWRIHWFYEWAIFHVVWIDSEHELYPMD